MKDGAARNYAGGSRSDKMGMETRGTPGLTAQEPRLANPEPAGGSAWWAGGKTRTQGVRSL